jgi:hypothetical protein
MEKRVNIRVMKLIHLINYFWIPGGRGPMIEFIALSAGVFCGLVIYQYRQPAGITPLDIIFCAAVAGVANCSGISLGGWSIKSLGLDRIV